MTRRLLLALVALLGCGSSGDTAGARPSASAAPPSPAPASAPAPSASAPPAGEPGADENRGQRRKFGDATLFVDGQPRGVFRLLELPAKLPRRDATLVDGRRVARWRVSEYLALAGVDLARLKELHVIGGRGRTSVIPGDEVRRLQDKLLFSFTRGETGGKPRFHWPPGLRTNTTIDIVGVVCAYVDRPPPRYDKKKRALFAADGTKFEGIPYVAPEDQPKGTRVYRDGKYVGFMKKKLLSDALLAPDARVDAPRFSLAAFLASLGLDPSKAQAIDLVDGDALGLRLSPQEWRDIKDSASFAVGSGSRGRALLRLPAGRWPDEELPVSAVLLHEAQVPPLPAHVLDAQERAGSREPQVETALP